MKYNNRQVWVALGLFLLAGLIIHADSAESREETLFRQAKVLIFDKEWSRAVEILDRILDKYPDSPVYPQALFYKGKCLKEMDRREEEALKTFKSFIGSGKGSESLIEEADLAVIDLSLELYKDGKKKYLREAERLLLRPNRVVRYYAAYQISRLDDKKVARKALPVLEEMLKNEADNDLLDRARIAMLRIDPESLRDFQDMTREKRPITFNIEVIGKWNKKSTFALTIPWSLADLALGAIPEEEKDALRKHGYHIDKIIDELLRFRGRVIEINTEKSIIKIWID